MGFEVEIEDNSYPGKLDVRCKLVFESENETLTCYFCFGVRMEMWIHGPLVSYRLTGWSFDSHGPHGISRWPSDNDPVPDCGPSSIFCLNYQENVENSRYINVKCSGGPHLDGWKDISKDIWVNEEKRTCIFFRC